MIVVDASVAAKWFLPELDYPRQSGFLPMLQMYAKRKVITS